MPIYSPLTKTTARLRSVCQRIIWAQAIICASTIPECFVSLAETGQAGQTRRKPGRARERASGQSLERGKDARLWHGYAGALMDYTANGVSTPLVADARSHSPPCTSIYCQDTFSNLYILYPAINQSTDIPRGLAVLAR